ncbi:MULTISPECIES: AAA family ATPase [Sphingobacterium]|uniref:AAA family ATPase n=1 Tax=Sphingobacterium TaxID=28453 RepID=UPI0013D9B797|nr:MULTISPECIES: AAA family ATPase [unclassified Sphingobacterium]
MKNFISKKANQWIEEATVQPIPKMLFSEFWFENELCILFADSNLGKSILAVQIADSISSRRAINGFKLESEKQKVLYFDFELSKKQFETRYSDNYLNHYEFDENFIRTEINNESIIKESELLSDFINEIKEQGAKIIIMDNMTFLLNDIEKSSIAGNFMKELKQIKTELDLSILILAHTPKRDFARPISNNDLQGSKMLINFADSAFAIGKSYTDINLRYIKQIKQRNCEHIYNENNICLCSISKGHVNNFLQFQFIEYGNETEHLNYNKTDHIVSLEETYRLKDEEALSNSEIARRLKISESAVRKRLNKRQT